MTQYAEWFEHLRSSVPLDDFDVIEVPSYYPFAHLIKKGPRTRLRLVLHGMNSHLLAAGYENHATLFEYVRGWQRLEVASVASADEIVAASLAEKASFEEQFGYSGDVTVPSPFLFLPSLASAPRIEPLAATNSVQQTDALNLIYVGPLDGVHEPHRLSEVRRRVSRHNVNLKAYGPSLKFRANESSSIIRTIAPEIEISQSSATWWELEDPDITIVVYPGRATVNWLPLHAVMRGYTVCLSDRAGCKQMFDDCGLEYARVEDTTALEPLPRAVRLENIGRMLSALRSNVASPSAELGEHA
ncbi:hypothetical protein I6F35_02510 [Bradyrhizobium sp. BRP22]|uniref:hypothetical protein n=1 Tax=Bradyrhizobium sp. BRP22 TaxID=2793821 RepID=UPI001CD25E8A|nr:hypothetical protein [Bradyrhizobium sp. BRP22]MCA1452087.1 hypothetical protein [Bradyrhizobium sp. BRP22]